MRLIEFEANDCSKVLDLLDSYISGELLVETNHKVLGHLERCASCSAECESREILRQSLRAAVRRDEASDELRERIRRQIREPAQSPQRSWSGWGLTIATAMAVLVIAIGSWIAMVGEPEAPGSVAAVPESASNEPVLRVGLADHVHCAVQRELASVSPKRDQIVRSLGDQYALMADPVLESIPAGFSIVEAHRCRYLDKRFVHFVLRGEGTLVSLIVTPKGIEAFDPRLATRDLAGLSGPIFHERLDGYDVVGFETREHLAYVISGLSQQGNLAMTARVEPAIRGALLAIEG